MKQNKNNQAANPNAPAPVPSAADRSAGSPPLFEEFISKIDDAEKQTKLRSVFAHLMEEFPQLVPRIAWNQPMFTDHGTFILGISVANQHFSVAPERVGMIHFADEIRASGYDVGKMLFRIRWDQPIDLALLRRIVAFNIADKADCDTFWRK